MDMSLDDIIKQNKIKKGPRSGQQNKGKGGGRSGAKPAAGKGKPAGGKGKPAVGNPSPKRNFNQGNRKPGGGVLRGRNQGGITRRNGGGFAHSMPSHKREAFLGTSAPSRFGSRSEATKLIVSNLDFGVTDSDVLELFGEFGPMKSAGVHYDRSGRSLGSADLVFERRADAIKAMKQYNGVPLDGREMSIQLAVSEIPSSHPVRPANVGRNFNKPQNSNRGNNKPRGAAGNQNQKKNQNQGAKKGNKPGGRAKKAPPPTAEELDAQLEEYVKSKVTSSDGA